VFHIVRRILQYAAHMPSPQDFRRIVLGLDGAIESEHMGHPDFRAHGRIFATLQFDPQWGMVKLTPEQQRRLVRDAPDVFKPAAGAWGAAGSTLVHLRNVDEEVLGEAITMSWQNAAAAGANRKKAASAARARTAARTRRTRKPGSRKR
jgi:hypothetical protein